MHKECTIFEPCAEANEYIIRYFYGYVVRNGVAQYMSRHDQKKENSMKFTAADFRKLFTTCGMQVSTDPNSMLLLGIRGSKADKYMTETDCLQIEARPLEADKYRCTIVQLFKFKLMAFQATTVPGAPYTVNPENPQGVARLVPGMWEFKRGLHKGEHPALVQGEPFVVLRDTDHDYNMDWESDFLDAGSFGINLHSGGGSDNISRWSAGCQVIRGEVVGGVSKSWDSRQWTAFKSRAYSSSNSVYEYLLLPSEWLEKMVASDAPYCMHGSSGSRVGAIQTKLGLKVDGSYGIATAKAVGVWQKNHSVQANGVVGPTTAAAMEI